MHPHRAAGGWHHHGQITGREQRRSWRHVRAVTLLGSPQKVQFTRDASGLKLKLPPWKPSDFASVLKTTGLKSP